MEDGGIGLDGVGNLLTGRERVCGCVELMLRSLLLYRV